MLKKKKTVVFLAFLISAMAVYIASAKKVQGLRDRFDPTQTVSALHVRPELLQVISGEFQSLVADYLMLKASVYLGGRWSTPDEHKSAVSVLFRQSATLDPYFVDTCFLTQSFLPWWKGKYIEEAIEILTMFKEHRDWDWVPGSYIGFDYFYFLKDNITASRYMMEASKLPYSPPIFGLLGARLSQRGGRTQTAIAFLKAMHAGEKSKLIKEEIERRIGGLEGVLILEKAIRRFKSMFFNRPPDKLDQLVEAGVLKELPKNSARKDGLFVYKDGQIDF